MRHMAMPAPMWPRGDSEFVFVRFTFNCSENSNAWRIRCNSENEKEASNSLKLQQTVLELLASSEAATSRA